MGEIGDRHCAAADQRRGCRAPCRAAARAAGRAGRARRRSASVEGWTVSPRKSRRKSPCFSSTVVGTPARAKSRPATIPAGPPPTMQRSFCPSPMADNGSRFLHKGKMHADFQTSGFSDALVILGAAGVVIPAFARFRISPVIGFILVGLLVGPAGLGAMAGRDALAQLHHHLQPGGGRAVRRVRHRPPAVRDRARAVVPPAVDDAAAGLRGRRGGAARLRPADRPRAARCSARAWSGSVALGLALALSSTALVLPLVGTTSPVGRSALAMLLFEDLAIVPIIFALGRAGALRRGERLRRAGQHPAARRRRRRRDAGARPAAAAAPVRPGGADQEPGAVPGGEPAGGDRRQPRHHRRRPVAADGGAARRHPDRRDRLSQRGRGDHRAVPRARARHLPDHGGDERRPQARRRQLGEPRAGGGRRRAAQGAGDRPAAAPQRRPPGGRRRGRADHGLAVRDHPDRARHRRGGAADQRRDRRLLADRHRHRPHPHAAAGQARPGRGAAGRRQARGRRAGDRRRRQGGGGDHRLRPGRPARRRDADRARPALCRGRFEHRHGRRLPQGGHPDRLSATSPAPS